jgi:hypothetical protein
LDIQKEQRIISRHIIATDISLEIHREIKKLALEKNQTLKLWLNNAILEAINKSK